MGRVFQAEKTGLGTVTDLGKAGGLVWLEDRCEVKGWL